MRVLILGAGGMLGQAVTHALSEQAFDVRPLGRADLDVLDTNALEQVVRAIRPHAIVNCAAYTRVDDAEAEEALALRINADAAAEVARLAREMGARCVYPSSDYVFDGRARQPYAPDAATAPLGAYARSKLAGEAATRGASDYLIVRTSWLYGPGGRNFVRAIVDRARAGRPLRVVADQHGAPTWTPEPAKAIAALLKHGAPSGTYHATCSGDTTWYEFALEIVRRLNLGIDVEPCSTAEYGAPAPRPQYSVLDSSATERLTGRFADWRTCLGEALQSGAF